MDILNNMDNLGDAAIEPGDGRTLIVDAWTDIPDYEERFGMVKKEEGKLYALAICFPYIDCSSDEMNKLLAFYFIESAE